MTRTETALSGMKWDLVSFEGSHAAEVAESRMWHAEHGREAAAATLMKRTLRESEAMANAFWKQLYDQESTVERLRSRLASQDDLVDRLEHEEGVAAELRSALQRKIESSRRPPEPTYDPAGRSPAQDRAYAGGATARRISLPVYRTPADVAEHTVATLSRTLTELDEDRQNGRVDGSDSNDYRETHLAEAAILSSALTFEEDVVAGRAAGADESMA